MASSLCGLCIFPPPPPSNQPPYRFLPNGCPRCKIISMHSPWRVVTVTSIKLGLLSGFSRYDISTSKQEKRRGLTIAFAASSVDPVATLQLSDDVNIDSEQLEDQKFKVAVNVTAKGTQKAFDVVLDSLGKSAPPVKGFRKGKGGKSIVPKNVLYQMLVPSRVNKFVIQEIVTSTILDYVKKENIKVKKNFKTVQTSEELGAMFRPGERFDFDAILELEEVAETEKGLIDE